MNVDEETCKVKLSGNQKRRLRKVLWWELMMRSSENTPESTALDIKEKSGGEEGGGNSVER